MKNVLPVSIKKFVQISLSVIMVFYSSYLLAYKEIMRVGFDNQTDKAIFYKLTINDSIPDHYGVIEPRSQSNAIEVIEIEPKFSFSYRFIFRDVDSGEELAEEAAGYSEEEGYREFLLFLHPGYKLKTHWVDHFNIRYEIK